MSIQTELTRLTTAKNAIVSAIEGKGVDVPSGSKLDALAALVESIEAGGGSGGGAKIETGEFTMSADAQYYDVSHSLGVAPKIILCWVKNYETTAGYFTIGVGISDSICGYSSYGWNYYVYAKTSSIGGQYAYPGEDRWCKITEEPDGNLSKLGAFAYADGNSFRVNSYKNSTLYNSNFKLHAGKTYVWVVVG